MNNQQVLLIKIKAILITFVCSSAFFTSAPGLAQNCGSLLNSFGPFDYTDPESRRRGFRGNKVESRLSVVEDFHFYEEIENLTLLDHNGQTNVPGLLKDLDYTLRAFPNHHRALYSLSKLERMVGQMPQRANYAWPRNSYCFFDRAKRFAPKDATVHLLQGIHLHLTGDLQDAKKAYQRSAELNPDSADLQYNMGLLLVDLGELEQAKQHAQKAYQLGHRQPGLRNKLARAGVWP